MNCAELHELAASYALDALSEEERLACVRHLEHEGPHDGCEELVSRYQRVVDALAGSAGKREPAPGVWAAIEQRLGIAKVIPLGPPRWREALAWSAAAAALLAAVWSYSSGLQTYSRLMRDRQPLVQDLTNTQRELTSAQLAQQECASALEKLTGQSARDAVALLELPSTKLTQLTPAGDQAYRASALYNPDTRRALVISSSIKPVEGKDFELWVIATGEAAPRPAGFLRFDASGVAVGELDPTLLSGTRPAAFAVSLEPAGGRPTPTEVVLIGKLQG